MTPLEWVGAATATASAVTAAGGAGALLLRAERRGRRLVTGLLGDGVRQGVLERLDAVETTMAVVEAQLSPDSGRSLHDVLVRVDERTEQLVQRLDAHIASPHPRR